MCPVFIGSLPLGRSGALYKNVLSITNLIIAVLGTAVARWMAFGRLLPYWRPLARFRPMVRRRLNPLLLALLLRFGIVALGYVQVPLFSHICGTPFSPTVKMPWHIFGLEISRDIVPLIPLFA